MTKQNTKKQDNMVYTPEQHIPVGQAVKISKGKYGLLIKKDKKYELIPMGGLMEQVVHTAESRT